MYFYVQIKEIMKGMQLKLWKKEFLNQEWKTDSRKSVT